MSIAAYIDNTLLKADATPEMIERICAESVELKTASVCVNPAYVPLVKKCLEGSGVKTCCVIGFPLGMNATRVKAFEAAAAVEDGAEELDMVINVGMLKAGDAAYVKNDIKAVVDAAKGRLVKVIIETCLLTDEEKVLACELAKEAGADFVKTSTGFSTAGANAHDIALMRKTVGPEMGVKASGGVRDYAFAMELINAGASRIGASSGKKIAEGEQAAK
ncbi:MAG: deoxyribose-phosphate aldolase [Clostridia bacterium]|nr:deoxyribose-phosphate aldolase [Clostridia bacterium]MBR6498357.1 deoxyribose-phosphate aldolase [Clostridia bacterium]